MKSKISRIKLIIVLVSQDVLYLLSFLRHREDDELVHLSKLRTMCHIIDKGLNIVDFEIGHSIETYNNALFLKEQITTPKVKSDPSYEWCINVLNNYKKAQNGITASKDRNCPIIYSESEREFFYDFVRSRVSCRNFVDKQVSEVNWNQIIELAIDAPNGCCRQTTRYYVIHDPDKISKVIPFIKGATCFNGFIPYLICVVADIRPYSVVDRYLPIIDASLSIENFVLAARANNIYTTILNWRLADFIPNRHVKEILKIPEYEQIVVFIAAGYSDTIPVKPCRMSVDKVCKI